MTLRQPPLAAADDQPHNHLPNPLVRILLVHNFYQQFGGEDFLVRQEMERLRTTDDVSLYTRDNQEIKTFSAREKVKFVFDTIACRKTRTDIRGIVARFQPDFAYVHNIFPLISPSVYHALHELGIPILQLLHNFRPLCANGCLYTQERICMACKGGHFFQAVKRKCFRNSYSLSALYAASLFANAWWGEFDKIDAFLCPTRFAQELLVDFGVAAAKTFVRPHSIDASAVTPLPGEGQYVAYLGRLSSEKGVWTLVRAFEQLQHRVLKIAGTGPLELPLREYIRRNNLRNISLVGFKSGAEKWEFLKHSRFTVVPSECHEMFGLVLLESFAAGKPVVGSNLGGIPSILEDGKSGVLVNPGQPAELAEKVEFLHRSPELAERMGSYARRVVETQYSTGAGYRSLLQIAQQVTRRHTGPPVVETCVEQV